MDYSAMVNDSTDAEGEPDTTTSAPPIAVEKANGESAQKLEVEPQGESKSKTSPAPEVCTIYVLGIITVLTPVLRLRTMMNFRSVIAYSQPE